jgi:hypothetical protein
LLICAPKCCLQMGKGRPKVAAVNPFMKFPVRQSDVIVWGSLKGRRAERVLAESLVRILTVVVDGAEMC